MNTEIEKLIDLALADGEITDKERSVILKKAVKLGEDPDEVEMILDGRLHESKKLKTKEKVGNIKICPSCGETIEAFQLNCSSCGQELNRNKNKNLLELIQKLEKEDNKNYEWDSDRSEKKSKLISQYVIPQSKGDLLDFISHSLPIACNFDYDDDERNSWKIKLEQALVKFESIANSKEDLVKINLFNKRLKELNKKTSSRNIKWGIGITLGTPIYLFVVYLMFAFFAALFGFEFWPFN